MTPARWPPDVQRARELVLTHGWNATAYQIVNPGITHWFSARGDGVVGYVRHAGVRVVAGAPVCAEQRLGEVAAEFEHHARHAGDRVCYFGAEARLERLCRDSRGHALALLGAQPAWRPDAWEASVRGHASLRAQLNRARNKGVRVTEWEAPRAGSSPLLRELLSRWLGGRGLPPLHFLIEPDTLERLDDRRVFVAEMPDGRVLGFVVLSPVPERRGWLTEQFVRARSAPNGTVEMLLHVALSTVARDGAAYATMGLAPLSRHGGARPASEPFWLRLTLEWVRAHGRRFYNFDGLEAFKAKFGPSRWEPVYAIEVARRFSPRALYAIAGAFGGCSPIRLLAATVWRAARQEGRWLSDRLRSPGTRNRSLPK